MFFPYISVWSTEYLAPTRDEAKFLAFLSLYGPKGVSLRDLIRFATLRASGRPSQNHWLLSGEVGPILRPLGDKRLPTHCSFLKAFVRETSNDQGIYGLQGRLLSWGLIRVEYPRFAVRRANEQIWCVAVNPVSSHLMVPTWHDLDGENIIMDLLYVFLEIPSKDVSLLAERHRETFYTHARIFALEILRLNHTVLQDARDYTVTLILQLLTHRSQYGDKPLIQFAKAWPSSANSSDWTIMVLWAELKENVFCGVSSIETALTNRITRLLSWKGKRQRRANGLIGYLLVEWMKAAEISRDSRLISQIVNYAMDWAEIAWSSGSSIERAALCCVLARFGMLDKSVLVSPKYHLLYGHHLSRAGHLREAKDFLTSGFLYYSSLQLSTRLWGYQFELASVLIRLSNRQQAEILLMDIEEHTMSRNGDRKKFYTWEHQHTIFPFGDEEFDIWERWHEHAESRILTGLYQAELLMSAGEVSLAASRLENTIDAVGLMDRGRSWKDIGEDTYLRSLRLALEMRLLEVQTWEDPLERALEVAERLMIEFCNEPNLGPDMAQWIMQQLLTLSNRLVCAGNMSAALSLLENMLKIFRYQHYSDLLKDLLPYAEHRMATVSDLLATDHARNSPTAVGHEIRAATNERPEGIHKPSPRIETKIQGTNSQTCNRRTTKKASLTKPTFPWKNLQRGPLSRTFVQQGVRRSLATLLRRAPRVPTTEPAIPVVEHKGKEPVPVPMEPPLTAELATA